MWGIMSNLPITGGTSPLWATDESSEKTINWYPIILGETDASRGKPQPRIMLKPTAGLTTQKTFATSPIRGMASLEGTALIVVAGNKVYRWSTTEDVTYSGTIGTSTGPVTIIVTDVSSTIVILDGTSGYTVSKTGSSAPSTISDTDFTSNVADRQDLVQLDGISFLPETGAHTVRRSAQNSFNSWPSTGDTLKKEGYWDDVVTIAAFEKNLYVLGRRTIEAWYNAGNAVFGFERIPDFLIHQGCAGWESTKTTSRGVMFIGLHPDSGQRAVFLLNGNGITKVSTESIDQTINDWSDISDTFAMVYSLDGNEFFTLTNRTAEQTLEINLSNGLWHERASEISSSQVRWRVCCIANIGNTLYGGDYQSGKLFTIEPETYQEDSTDITRTRITPVFMQEDMKKIFWHELGLDMKTGVGTSITMNLYISRDGGNTYGSANSLTVSSSSTDYARRVRFFSLGASHTFTFKFTTTANADVSILGGYGRFLLGDM